MTTNTPDLPKSVRKQWVLDVTWSDCPADVAEEVREAWCDLELGNDNYFFQLTMDNDDEEEYPLITKWCRENGIPDGETVWVHWCW